MAVYRNKAGQSVTFTQAVKGQTLTATIPSGARAIRFVGVVREGTGTGDTQISLRPDGSASNLSGAWAVSQSNAVIGADEGARIYVATARQGRPMHFSGTMDLATGTQRSIRGDGYTSSSGGVRSAFTFGGQVDDSSTVFSTLQVHGSNADGIDVGSYITLTPVY